MINPLKESLQNITKSLARYTSDCEAGILLLSALHRGIEELPTEREMYFLEVGNGLTPEQYERLKENINEVWPKTKPRPVLLEGVTVKKL